MELIVGRDGKPCSLSVVRGESVPLIAALRAAVARWRFRPFIGNGGEALCLRMNMLVYVREERGRTMIIIPGLTDRPDEGGEQ
jgi:hypothetical protein